MRGVGASQQQLLSVHFGQTLKPDNSWLLPYIKWSCCDKQAVAQIMGKCVYTGIATLVFYVGVWRCEENPECLNKGYKVRNLQEKCCSWCKRKKKTVLTDGFSICSNLQDKRSKQGSYSVLKVKLKHFQSTWTKYFHSRCLHYYIEIVNCET